MLLLLVVPVEQKFDENNFWVLITVRCDFLPSTQTPNKFVYYQNLELIVY